VAVRLRLQVVANRKKEALIPFVLATVQPGAIVRTDGRTECDPRDAAGYIHDRVAVHGDHALPDAHVPMIHIVFGNLDAWLRGSADQHAAADLRGGVGDLGDASEGAVLIDGHQEFLPRCWI